MNRGRRLTPLARNRRQLGALTTRLRASGERKSEDGYMPSSLVGRGADEGTRTPDPRITSCEEGVLSRFG